MKAKWEEFEFTEFIEPFKSAAFISKIFTSFVVFNESGRKIATRKGKFTEEDLNKIFQAQ
jgi:hypothetical protein